VAVPVPSAGYAARMSETTPEPVPERTGAATPDEPEAERAQEGVQEAFDVGR
jgi:hypothetical protein